MPPCGAKTRSGEPCKRPAMANGRCYTHGGKSLAGIASPSFKTGRYSRYMPKRLLDRYEAAISDKELLVLRDEIALVEVRVTDLLAALSPEAGEDAWREAQSCNEQLQSALQARDAVAARTAAVALARALQPGKEEKEIWGEITRLTDLRRKLVEAERGRLVELSQMITAEQAMMLVVAISHLVRQHVSDPEALRAISDGIRSLVAAGE